MKIGSFRVWRSPIVCWCWFALFAVLFLAWQMVDEKPYPHMRRDDLIGSFTFGAAASTTPFSVDSTDLVLHDVL
jgi:hypothetical protein